MKVLGQMQDLLQVRDDFPAAPIEFEFLKSFAYQVLGLNRLFAVRLVFGGARLEIKTDREFIGMPAFKFGKLTQLFTRNHENTSRISALQFPGAEFS